MLDPMVLVWIGVYCGAFYIPEGVRFTIKLLFKAKTLNTQKSLEF
jgi:hypothetical protein